MEPVPHLECFAIRRAVYELVDAPPSSESKIVGFIG